MTAEAGGHRGWHRGVAPSCDGGSARTIAGVRMPTPFTGNGTAPKSVDSLPVGI
jgi:hypothetical protein